MLIALRRLADKVAAREQIEVPLAVNGAGHGRGDRRVRRVAAGVGGDRPARQRARNDTVADVAVSVDILAVRLEYRRVLFRAEVLVGRRARAGDDDGVAAGRGAA